MIKREEDRERECARDLSVAVSLRIVRIGRLYRDEYNLYPERGAVPFSVPPPWRMAAAPPPSRRF